MLSKPDGGWHAARVMAIETVKRPIRPSAAGILGAAPSASASRRALLAILNSRLLIVRWAGGRGLVRGWVRVRTQEGAALYKPLRGVQI